MRGGLILSTDVGHIIVYLPSNTVIEKTSEAAIRAATTSYH